MRYTEHEFKIDHVFDFIRVFFSSIFLAPYRLLNEYSRKILLLDKKIIKYNMLCAIGFNLLFLAREVYKIFTCPYLQISDTYLVEMCISLVVIMVVFYLTSIFDKPVLTDNIKGVDIKTKEVNKEVFLADEDVITDATTEAELRTAMSLDDDAFDQIKVKEMEDFPIQNTMAVDYDVIPNTNINILRNVYDKMDDMSFEDPMSEDTTQPRPDYMVNFVEEESIAVGDDSLSDLLDSLDGIME